MRKLMAAAAAMGVAAVTTRAASGHDGTYTVTIAPDAAPPDDAGAANNCNGPNPGSQCYAVVDPLPPPPASRGCGCGKVPGMNNAKNE